MAYFYKIAVLGLWHLGEVYSVCLAELGHKVIGVDANPLVIENFSRNIPPLAEPGLEELLKSNQANGRLSYTADIGQIKGCDTLWVAFDTPVDDDDNADLKVIYSAIEDALPYLQSGVVIIVSSQLTIGTSKKIKELIARRRPDLEFKYVYAPENLRLGEAVRCFFEPERIVVGADSPAARDKMKNIFGGLSDKILSMSSASAEMAKHALNAFLATSLSFTYDIADACEASGADVTDVAKSLRADSRIGEKAYLDASAGFSGGTLGRDLKALLALAENEKIDLPVIDSVFKKNAARKNIVFDKLKKELGGLENKTAAIFGLTYKAGTSTLRRSLALEVAALLEKAGARTRLCDPKADGKDILKDPYETASGAEAVILMTPWPEFKNLDWRRLRQKMKAPAVFFDTRNFLSDKEKDIGIAGFKYLGVGRPALTRRGK